MIIKPRVDILPEAQKILWPMLRDVPKDFVLYGGTAIALRYGHRKSVDFDFFSSLSDNAITNSTCELPFIKKFAVNYNSPYLQTAPSASQVIYDLDMGKGDLVEITFMRDPNFVGGAINSPHVSIDNGVKIASPLDLMATKINAVLFRQSVKDLVDIAEMIRNKVSFSRGFAYAMALKAPYLPQIGADYSHLLNAMSSNEFYVDSFARDKNAPIELKHLANQVSGIITKEAEKLSIARLLSMKLKVSPHLHNVRERDECER